MREYVEKIEGKKYSYPFSIHAMHLSTNFGKEIQRKKSPGTNGLSIISNLHD